MHTLPKLNYSFNALEPYIDAKTMEIHYFKHHQAYVDNFNKVIQKYPQFANEPLESLMKKLETLEMNEADKTLLRNHGGGHLNHTFFWSIMDPGRSKDEKLISKINSKFGSLDKFKAEFSDAAMKRFGSGWAWLVESSSGELSVYSTPNQDSPLLNNERPLLGVDVWEHAYYLKYQNRRVDYLQAWWNTIHFL